MIVIYFIFAESYRLYFFFFFFKQKTAYEITYGDWSSDVCSSDLCAVQFAPSDRLINSSHNPGGWYGETLAPPMRSSSNPLTASAWSRMNSAGRRKRGPRASSRFSGSCATSSGVIADDCRYVA